MSATAVAARGRRINELGIRRFNYTLKEFIEFKYSDIFEEYSVFYKALSGRYPTKKNLMKTTEFKEWKKQTIEQTFENDGICAVVTDLTPPETDNEASEPSDREFASEESTASEASEESTASEASEESTASEASEESTASEASEESMASEVSDPEFVNGIIDEVVRDLERDALIAEILNDDDEGIALDFQTELESIVESFDYELEVDF